MALSVDKTKLGITTPQTEKTNGGSTVATNKSVEMHLPKDNTEQNTAIVNFLKSDEFKNAKDPYALFKQMFCANLSDNDAQKFYVQAKTLLATQHEVTSSTNVTGTTAGTSKTDKTASTPVTQNVSSTSKVGVTSSSSVTSTTEITDDTISTTAKGTTPSTQNTSDIEQKAEAYIKSKGLNIDIDDLYANLATNSNKTPEEVELFKQLHECHDSSTSVSSSTQESGQTANGLSIIDPGQIVDEKWLNLTPQQKIKKTSKTYFDKFDDKYKSMPEGDNKSKYLRDNMNNLALSLTTKKDKHNLTLGDYTKVPELLEYLAQNKVSVKDYMKLSPAERTKFYQDNQLKAMQSLANLVPEDTRKSQEWRNKSATEKLEVYADKFAQKYVPEYKNMSKEEKAKFLKNKSNEMISKFIPNWDKYDDKQKEALFSDAMTKIGAALNQVHPMSFDEFSKQPLNVQRQSINEYKRQLGINRTDADTVYDETMTKWMTNHPGKTPTYDDLIKEITNNKNIDTVTKKQLLNSLNLGKSFNDGLNKHVSMVDTYEQRASRNKASVDQIIQDDFDQLGKIKNPKAQRGKFMHMLEAANGDKEILDKIKKHAQELNLYTDKEINAFMAKAGVGKDMMIRASRNNSGELFEEGLKVSNRGGDKKACEIGIYNIPRALTGDAKVKVHVSVINDLPQYTNILAKGINAFEKDAVNYSKSLLMRDDVSDSGKSVFSKEIVVTASNDEKRIEYVKALSPIKNPAVTEGLAAASNSVTSPSARKQYDNYVDNAVNSYPPEERASVRAAVNQARETGEISQSTLSKTNHSENTSEAKHSDRSSSSENTAQSHKSEGRTSTSSVPQTSSTSSAKNPKTAASQNVDKAKETQILQQKKEALLDKIDKYETKKAEEIKKREEAKKSSEAGSADSPSSAEKTSSTQETDKVEKEEKTSTSVSDIQLSEDEQKTLKEVIIQTVKTQGIAAAFGELSSSHQDKLLEVFAQKGKESDVRSFADSYRGSESTLLKIYNYTQSESLRLDILRIMPSSSIKQLLNSQKIGKADFDKLVSENKVDSDVIFDYINKNRAGMSIDEMKKYSKYLSLDYQIELNRLISQKSAETKGSDDWQIAQQENMRTFPSEVTDSYSEDLAMENGLPLGSNKMSMRGQYDKMKKNGPFFMKA